MNRTARRGEGFELSVSNPKDVAPFEEFSWPSPCSIGQIQPPPARPFTMDVIQNKVAESGIEVDNLEAFLPEAPISEIDLAEFLAGGFILREKDFRAAVKGYDWKAFDGHHVGIFCSTDAIIPTWAYMLVGVHLDGIAASVTAGREADIREALMRERLSTHDWDQYKDTIVVLKGCGSDLITPAAYVLATSHLQQVARKMMYGEPCSSVPIWRRPAGA